MASHHNDVVFPEDLDDDEDEEEEDDDVVLGEPDDDEETDPSPSSSSALTTTATVKNTPIPTATATAIETMVPEHPKRERSEQIEEKKPVDDSRRLFQRLWTDEDEIGLLQGFLDYTTDRGRGSGSSHYNNDTALFYDQIKSKLQLGFNKNQLVEKLRRLKKKYRNVLNKIASGKEFSFKSPHDQATFEISHKIWSNTAPMAAAAVAVEDNSAFDDDEINLNHNLNPNPNFGNSKNEANSAEKRTPPSRKRSKRELNDRDINYISNNNNNNNSNNHNNNCSSGSIKGLIEETVKSCLSPLLKEIVSSPFGGRGFAWNSIPWSLNLNLNLGSGEVVDEKWRMQQIMELEVYSKRLELVQDEIKAALNELRLAGAGG